ncbi:cytochrome b N-terminal domain-containing protein [Caldithrix abyssi]
MNYERLFQNRYWLPKLGEITLSSLQIALISGVLLIPGMQSLSEPFKSVSTIVNSGLFGHFLQSCHTYAGDLFLIALALHSVEYLLKRSFTAYHWKSWLWLVILLAVGVLTVFSGFLSMGNLESLEATQIMKHILKTAGAAGEAFFGFLLMSSQNNSTLSILLHHVATFSILTMVLTHMHLKRFKADVYAFYYTLVLIAFLALLMPASIGSHPSAELAVVKGPWYFRGLQEMLAWMPAWLAGVVFPLSILGLLTALPVWPQRQNLILKAIAVLSIFYLIESFIATFLRGAGWQLNVW